MDSYPRNQFSFPTRPSFSTAHRKGSDDPSHVRKTLSPGVPVLPLLPESFDAVGQWPVCCAGASPTEDPCYCGNMKEHVPKTLLTPEMALVNKKIQPLFKFFAFCRPLAASAVHVLDL